MYFSFTKYRKIFFIFSGILVIASIVLFVLFGLKPGIDFTGGTILELEYQEKRPSNQEIRDKLINFDLGSYFIQPTGEKAVILRTKYINEDVHQQILGKLSEGDIKIEEKRFDSIGPTIGQELRQKTIIVIFLALTLMIIYIALAFRKIQRPLKSWKYGIVGFLTLSYDILIPLGVFSVLGKYYGTEITIPVITAFLTILGYSINNTVVVFDRIRENLLKRGGFFEEIVDKSINQTLNRQINTSLTTLFALMAIFLFGGQTLRYFSLALILGIINGAYSSIFLASPILLSWFKWRRSTE